MAEEEAPPAIDTSANSDAPVHERLYSLSNYLNQRREDQRSKHTEYFFKTLQDQQFKCSPKSAKMATHRQSGEGENYGQFLYEESLRSSEIQKDRLEKVRSSKKEAEVESCTFTPEISEFAKQLVREDDDPVYIRLEKLDREQKARLDDMARHANEDSAAELTFQPKINPYPLDNRRGDFFFHVQDKAQKKELRLASLKHEIDRQQGITHHPEISEYSRQLVRDDGASVFERLHQEATEKSIKLKQKQSALAASFDALRTSTISNRSLSERSQSSDDFEVQELLYQDAENRKIRRNLMVVQKELEEQAARNERKISNKSVQLARQRTEEEVRFLMSRFDENQDRLLDKGEFRDALFRMVPFKSSDMGLSELSDAEQDLVINRVWKALDPEDSGYADERKWFRFITSIASGDTCGMENQNDALEQIAFAVAHEFVIACLALKMHEPLPTRRGRTSDVKSFEEKELEECTFRPALDKKSTRIVQANLAGDVDRFEVLHTQHKEREERKKELANRMLAKEMEQCTFTPRINKNVTAREREVKDRDTFFEQLATPERSLRRPRTAETRTTVEKELQEHCSFAPATTPRRAPPVTNTPKGFKETIDRMRDAKEEQRRRELEAAERFKYSSKKKSVKPFSFMTEQRQRSRQAPLLFVDVSLGGGRSGRIGIHSGDDPVVLARNFATAYSLDDALRIRLERLLQAHIQQLAVASPTADDTTNTPRITATMRSNRSPNKRGGWGGATSSYIGDETADNQYQDDGDDDPYSYDRDLVSTETSRLTAAQRAEAILQEYSSK